MFESILISSLPGLIAGVASYFLSKRKIKNAIELSRKQFIEELSRNQYYKFFLPYKYVAEDFRLRLKHIENNLFLDILSFISVNNIDEIPTKAKNKIIIVKIKNKDDKLYICFFDSNGNIIRNKNGKDLSELTENFNGKNIYNEILNLFKNDSIVENENKIDEIIDFLVSETGCTINKKNYKSKYDEMKKLLDQYNNFDNNIIKTNWPFMEGSYILSTIYMLCKLFYWIRIIQTEYPYFQISFDKTLLNELKMKIKNINVIYRMDIK